MKYSDEDATLYMKVAEAVRARDEKGFLELVNQAKAKLVEIKLADIPKEVTIGTVLALQDGLIKMGIKLVL